MTSIGLIRRLVVSVGVVSLGFGAAAAEAAGEKLGFFESRRVMREAESALESGRYDEATELYGKLIAGSKEGSSRRNAALYGSALAAASKSPVDLVVLRERLDALGQAAAEDHRTEIAALEGLLERAAEAETARSRAEANAEPQETEPEPVAEGDPRVKSLQSQVRRLKKELEETRAELALKEEALEQLKEVVVGGGG